MLFLTWRQVDLASVVPAGLAAGYVMAAFEAERFPELFCGLDRSFGPPVPYLEANIPQAWAAAAPLTVVQLFLGLVTDAPHNRCYLSPWLHEWLPWL